MIEVFDILLSASFWGAVLRIASPLIFATMGELICERAGVLNLGIEGIMVIGAFAALGRRPLVKPLVRDAGCRS